MPEMTRKDEETGMAACSRCGKVRKVEDLTGYSTSRSGFKNYADAYCKFLDECDSQDARDILKNMGLWRDGLNERHEKMGLGKKLKTK